MLLRIFSILIGIDVYEILVCICLIMIFKPKMFKTLILVKAKIRHWDLENYCSTGGNEALKLISLYLHESEISSFMRAE